MVRLGILGMGYMGRVHREAARGASGIRVTAVATRRSGEHAAREEGLAVYADWRDLIDHAEIDAVAVCLPTGLHEEAVVRAARAGRHVLCEKPIAFEPAAAERMLAAVEKAGVVLMIAQVLRFWPHYRAVRNLLQDGRIGAVRDWSAFRMGGYPAWADWFRDPAQSGGALLDLLVHDLDFACWLMGTPLQTACMGRQSAAGGWDHVLAFLRYPECTVRLEASYLLPASRPFCSGLRIEGDEGCVEYAFRAPGNVGDLQQAGHSLLLYPRQGHAEPIDPAGQSDPYRRQLEAFAQAVRTGRPLDDCRPEDALAVLRIIDECRHALDTSARRAASDLSTLFPETHA